MKHIIALEDWYEKYINASHTIILSAPELYRIVQTDSDTQKILIVGTGDNTISQLSIPNWVYKIYSTNLNIKPSKKLYAMPFGILPRQSKLLSTIDINIEKIHLAYSNFGPNSHSSRKAIWKQTQEKDFIVCNRPTNKPGEQQTDKDIITYFTQISQSKFCISPRGNGLDTYRMWECLYLNCIPIVPKSDFILHFINKLPILAIDDYSTLTEDFLNEQYDYITSKQYDFSILYQDYWINLWNQDVKYLEETI